MSHVACPCGASLWDGDDSAEVEYEFVPYESIRAFEGPFFEIAYKPHMATEMWKCDICDRLMVFDDWDNVITRYMKLIDATTFTLPDEERFVQGIVYNNLFFNEVDEMTAFWTKDESPFGKKPAYGLIGPLRQNELPLTFQVLDKEVLSRANGTFRGWWYARMGQEHLVLYSPHDKPMVKQPVRVWEHYDQVWGKAAD